MLLLRAKNINKIKVFQDSES